MSHNDTIVAQATPPGRGGVGILRISGLKAREVAEAVLGKLPNHAMPTICLLKMLTVRRWTRALRCGSRPELLYR
jgi:tRNA U34 5-carboxymethylaminomethyl modifying GTPase MnmE/TrmE